MTTVYDFISSSASSASNAVANAFSPDVSEVNGVPKLAEEYSSTPVTENVSSVGGCSNNANNNRSENGSSSPRSKSTLSEKYGRLRRGSKSESSKVQRLEYDSDEDEDMGAEMINSPSPSIDRNDPSQDELDLEMDLIDFCDSLGFDQDTGCNENSKNETNRSEYSGSSSGMHSSSSGSSDSMSQAMELIDSFFIAFNNHDLGSLLSSFDEKIVTIYPDSTHNWASKSTAEKVYRSLFVSNPNISIDYNIRSMRNDSKVMMVLVQFVLSNYENCIEAKYSELEIVVNQGKIVFLSYEV